jgi:hypothetical protein
LPVSEPLPPEERLLPLPEDEDELRLDPPPLPESLADEEPSVAEVEPAPVADVAVPLVVLPERLLPPVPTDGSETAPPPLG